MDIITKEIIEIFFSSFGYSKNDFDYITINIRKFKIELKRCVSGQSFNKVGDFFKINYPGYSFQIKGNPAPKIYILFMDSDSYNTFIQSFDMSEFKRKCYLFLKQFDKFNYLSEDDYDFIEIYDKNKVTAQDIDLDSRDWTDGHVY